VSRREAPPLILSLAPPDSYAALARITLSRAGYSIVSAERWAEMSARVERAPDVVIADLECDGAGVPDGVPWIALAPRGAQRPPRTPIIGLIERPAEFHELYRLLQLALEPTPRATARVPTCLAARLRDERAAWHAQVISLSRGGCLLWREDPPPEGERFTVELDLPQAGRVEVRGETVYRRATELGMVFREVSPPDQRSIQRFVEERLLTR
jgi:hypothetical protein